MQKIIKGDKVRIISGKYKSKEGIVLSVNPKDRTVIVEGINKVKRHQKATQQNGNKGGIVEKEMPMLISKVALLSTDKKNKNSITKVGFKVEGGKKIRISKKSKAPIASKK